MKVVNELLYDLSGICRDQGVGALVNHYALKFNLVGNTDSILKQAAKKLGIAAGVKHIDFYSKKKKRKGYVETKRPKDVNKWLQLRNIILKLYGRKCMKCGKEPKKSKFIHVDHIKPKSLYPELNFKITNLQVLCKDCNEKKSNLNSNDYRTSEDKRKLEQYTKNHPATCKTWL